MHELAPFEAWIQLLHWFKVRVPGLVYRVRSGCLWALRFFLNACFLFIIFQQGAFCNTVEEYSHDVGVILKLGQAKLKHFTLIIPQVGLFGHELLIIVNFRMQDYPDVVARSIFIMVKVS